MFKKKSLLNLVQVSFNFLPISIVLGSLVINLNIFIFLILSSIFFYQEKIKLKLNKINTPLFLFFLIIIISSLINLKIIGFENFLKSILLLKFFLIYIFLETLFKEKKIELKNFFSISLYLIIFISLDVILQFITGKNILGFEPHDGRIAGIFGSEAIAGSFIQKIFLLSLIGLIINVNRIKIEENLFKIIFFIISISGCFLASNRMSFIILLGILIILLLFFKSMRKSLLISLVIILPIFASLGQTSKNLSSNYKDLSNKVRDSINVLEQKNEKNAFNSINYGRIYYASLLSFKDDMILGSGLKSFRYKCFDYEKYESVLCSTHPHNYHLEILHDTGLLGFLMLVYFSIVVLISKYKHLKSRNISYDEKIILAFIIFNFLIEIFPIKSTGSLFSTWTGTILWISVALLNYKRINGKK